MNAGENLKFSNKLRKLHDRPFFKLLMVTVVMLLSFLAIMAGVKAGDILYGLDADLIKKIDTETFRNTMKYSLPIIDNVYNNGKASTSFVGEVKSLFANIFGFDINSPLTILNVQSPLFMSYYKSSYAKAGNGMNNAGAAGGTGDGTAGGENGGYAEGGPNAAGTVDGTEAGTRAGAGTGAGTGTARNGDGGAGAGGEAGTGVGTGAGTDDAANATDQITDGSGSGNGGSGNGGAGAAGGEGSAGSGKGGGQTGGSGSSPDGINSTGSSSDGGDGDSMAIIPLFPRDGGVAVPEPVSSIAFEDEEEDKSDSNIISAEKVSVQNFTRHKIDIAKLLKEPLNLNTKKKGPQVLIYHTHTSESYVLESKDIGKKNIPSYNSNPKYNVVRVGEELARCLKKYGIETLHNATVHDKVRDAAYGVAIQTLQSYRKSYPSLQVYIDVHRDGLEPSKPKLRLTKKINGRQAAQIMFVVGTDDMLPHPRWQENLKFVLKLEQKLNEKYPGLARPVWVVGKRYNQQISDQAILVEVGGDGNLLSESLESVKYLAEALNDVLKGK